MKILLLANKDIASNLALNYLFQTIGKQHQFRLLLSATVGQNIQKKPQQLVELAFFEQHLFNEILFPALQNPPSPIIGKFLSFNGFKTLGLEVSDIRSINCLDGFRKVNEFAPDLIISIRFGIILQPAIIAVPKFGVINLHSGELPMFRGVMATFRAMQQNNAKCATTVHYISDSGIDSGEIVTISKRILDYRRSYLYNTLSLYKQGVNDVVNAITQIKNEGKCNSYSTYSQGNYFSFPHEQDLSNFQQKNLKLFEYQDIIDIAQNYY
jgi:methionyl-tRNA formyltransferase